MIYRQIQNYFGLQSWILWWILTIAAPTFAQMDTIHWIPPLYAQAGLGPQYIYLNTQETSAFSVSIRDGGGHLVKTAQISNTQPLIYTLSDTYSQLLIADNRMGDVLTTEGLVISGSKPFYATLRARSADGADACQLTCKGRAALGKAFRIGHLKQVTDKTGGRSNFIGVMATQDDTQVTLSGFDPTTEFTGSTSIAADGKVHVTLQHGESVAWAHYVGGVESDQPRNSFMGALVASSQPVAINCGSWLGAPVIYAVNDIAADQIVPVERVGKEYILCRGSGPISLENVLVIAHENGTQVWINGDSTPVATLDGGKHVVLPTNSYSQDGILYIRSSRPIFVYHMTGGVLNGFYSLRQAGFAFVPPINCGLPHSVGPIIQPFKIDDVRFDGNLSIVAVRDSAVTLLVNGAPKALSPPFPVPGNPDFVAYRQIGLFSHANAFSIKELSVISSAAIQVELVEYYKEAGFTALYAGFESRSPEVQITRKGDGICPDTLMATGFFDGLQWIYDGAVLQHGPDKMFIVRAPGPYKVIGYLGGCFSTATVVDSIEVPLNAPQFPYTQQDATCFGYPDGEIIFGQPKGGVAPYLFSIGEDQGFTTETAFFGLAAGNYKLIVQDSIGCYNQPIPVPIGQPDSFYVNLSGINLPEPFLAGDLAELQAATSHPVATYSWIPESGDSCFNCSTYAFHPEYSSWVWIIVEDGHGCQATDSLYLQVDPRIYAPNAIQLDAPDGNDRFSLFSKDPLPIVHLRIFDRWGELVYARSNIQTNDPAAGWDGRQHSRACASGVYVFMAEVEIEPRRVASVKGSFVLLR